MFKSYSSDPSFRQNRDEEGALCPPSPALCRLRRPLDSPNQLPRARGRPQRDTAFPVALSQGGKPRSRGPQNRKPPSPRTRPQRTLQRGRPVPGRAPPEGALDLRVRGAAGVGGAGAGGPVRCAPCARGWRGVRPGDQKENLRPQKSARERKGQVFQGPSPEQSGQRAYKSDTDHTKCTYCSPCTTHCS